jgi:hypothetical protein
MSPFPHGSPHLRLVQSRVAVLEEGTPQLATTGFVGYPKEEGTPDRAARAPDPHTSRSKAADSRPLYVHNSPGSTSFNSNSTRNRVQASLHSHTSPNSYHSQHYYGSSAVYRKRANSSLRSVISGTSIMMENNPSDNKPSGDRADASPTSKPSSVDKMLGSNPIIYEGPSSSVTPFVGRPTTAAELLGQHPAYRSDPFSVVPDIAELSIAREQLQDYLCQHQHNDNVTHAISNVVDSDTIFKPARYPLHMTTTKTMMLELKTALGELENFCVGVEDKTLRGTLTAKFANARQMVTRLDNMVKHGLEGEVKHCFTDRDSIVELSGLMAARIQQLEGCIRDSEQRMQRLKLAFDN